MAHLRYVPMPGGEQATRYEGQAAMELEWRASAALPDGSYPFDLQQTGLDVAILSGGVFMNALLLTEAVEQLVADGFRVYRHRQVPPNDGGLSLGQLAVAVAVSAEEGAAHVPGNPR